ncbi:kinesin-like protein [Phytophthora infestans T30-4]|uniref:Kinesin-like protein n=2 Tax=Phytophthora infestans TaxID=4787 RepID=D0MYR4_PHYIT|nr:kinesin-like protein [Phytophthora infestans T30-4]EEY66312.1 kinesin-like protein [Phytophthora infestans T30-4]|eukprot:XP_002906911.1 kinesin-like protein [Phytophthora infestans T30-4]
MSRVPEEEERVLNSKSDREKTYFYKKRYADTYEHAVALLKHAATLERERKDKQSDLEYLRSTIRTQTQIINTMSDNQHMNDPANYQQEKKIQALCREVTGLVMQLNERDTLINSLHEERDRSVKVINELKLSQGLTSSNVSETMRSTDEFRGMELKLESAFREKQEALERESKMATQLKELQLQFDKCETARSTLSEGLDRAEKQTTALHAQWVQEKKELLSSVKKNDQKSARFVVECERLQKENETLKTSLHQSMEKGKKHLLLMESQQQTITKSQTHIAQLEADLDELRPQLSLLSEKKTRIRTLESDLSGTREKLRRCLLHVDELEEKLEQREEEMQATTRQFQERAAFFEQRVFDAEAVRRSLHNKVMELKGNIRVFCRVRPVLQNELASSRGEEIFAFPDYRSERRQIELSANPKSHVGYGQNGSRSVVKKYNFDFDLVFDSNCSQQDVFLEVSALIQSALDGYNVCIFAYGQTGSGKTYTMQGREECATSKSMKLSPDMGIVGRAISHIFAGIEDLRTSGWDFTANLELVEIYNETLRDLLAPVDSTDKIDLRLDSVGKITVVNSVTHKVQNDQEAWSLLRGAMSRRSTKFTKMNDRSSRSHCVITFRLNGVNSLTGEQRTGVINLVDLAGSERLSKSGSDSNRELLKEAMSINKSLSALGNVICALAKKSTHVPFRDSKLTHFLSSSLGGDSKTLMICNLSPLGAHRDETLNSLRFAKMVNSCEIAFPSTVSSRS